ncbi:MAG: SDR family NAD(P)-dependent oxidoreductase [Pseudomonadota bacterium]
MRHEHLKPLCGTRWIERIVLITGATDGNGLEIAKDLAAHGHRALLHERSSEQLTRVLNEVGGEAE